MVGSTADPGRHPHCHVRSCKGSVLGWRSVETSGIGVCVLKGSGKSGCCGGGNGGCGRLSRSDG